MKQFNTLFLILFSLFLLNACSTTSDPAEAFKAETASQIFVKGEQSLRSKNYQQAIKRFEALDVQYPFDKNTEIAQLHSIYAYYMTSDYVSAEASADRFIHTHPTHPYIDYAYYMRGLSNYYQNLGLFERIFNIDLATRDLVQIKKSYNDFSQITTRFPQSRYAAPAQQYMIYLRNIMAAHQLEIGEYYYAKGAYVAAANRANLIIRHYQGAPVVPKALLLMSNSYRKLGLNQNAEDALRVYHYNYL